MSVAVPKVWIKVDFKDPDKALREAHVAKGDYAFWKRTLIKPVNRYGVSLAVDTTSVKADDRDFLANLIAECYDAEGRDTLEEIEKWGMDELKANKRNMDIAPRETRLGGREMVRVTFKRRGTSIDVVMYWLLEGDWSCSLTMKSARMKQDKTTFDKIASTIRTHL